MSATPRRLLVASLAVVVLAAACEGTVVPVPRSVRPAVTPTPRASGTPGPDAPPTAGPDTSGAPVRTSRPTHGPTVEVPDTIDATGRKDASRALTRFVASVPDGATIVFPEGAEYRMDIGLRLEHRQDLTFVGNGATLRSAGDPSCSRDCSLFYLADHDVGITIRDFRLVGNSPTPGVFVDELQHAAAVTVVGGGDIEIADVVVRGVGGDALTLTGLSPDWPDGVVFRDSHVESAGRMGVAVVSGRNVDVEGVAFDTVGYGVFDIEPNNDRQGAEHVRFTGNTAGGWTHARGFWFAANGAAPASISDVAVTDNEVTTAPLLVSVIVGRRQHIVVARNTSEVEVRGPVMRFAHVDGLTVVGNVQPLTEGTLLRAFDCTDVTVE